jgi:hypothetical protein
MDPDEISMLAKGEVLGGARFETPLETQVGGDHYKKYRIQPIEYCHANGLGACESYVIKYVTRWKDKGGIQDGKNG